MRISLTRFGWLFCGIFVAMVLAAQNYNNNLVYLLVCLLLSVFLLACIKGWANLFNIKLQDQPLDNTFAGDSLSLHQQITAAAHLNSRHLDIDIAATSGARNLHIPLSIDDGHDGLAFCPPYRGLLQVNTISIVSTYPLGLFRWRKTLYPQSMQAWIYPQPVDYGYAPMAEQQQGEEQADFDELVSMQAGEGLSGICWKTFARTGKKMKRKYTELSQDNCKILDWSQLPGLNDEEKLSQLCFWLVTEHRAGNSFGLKLPHITFAQTNGSAHYQQCLEALAAFRQQSYDI